jgi:mannosyltransferase
MARREFGAACEYTHSQPKSSQLTGAAAALVIVAHDRRCPTGGSVGCGHLLVTVLQRYGWALPAATTLAFCLFGITWPALWRDEISTWWAATLGLADLIRLLRNVDAVTAPYYVAMKAWVAVAGDSVLALRLPSALTMMGTAALLTVLGRRLFSASVGITAGMLFAVLPAVSQFGQEARGYGFAMLAATLATLALVGALERPGWLRWLGYAAAVTLLGWSHLLTMVSLLGHFAGMVAWARRRDGRVAGSWLLAVSLGVLPVLPLVWLGMRQRDQLSWLPKPSWRLLINVPVGMFGSVAVGWLIMGLVLAARWPDRRPLVVLVGWALLGPVALFAASFVVPVFFPRYLLFTLPAWCLLAAVAMVRSGACHRPLCGLVWGLVVVTLALIISVYDHRAIRQPTERQNADYAAALAIIGERFRPGDGIVYARQDWYFMLPPAMAYYLPPERRPRDVFAVTPAAAAGWWAATECAQPARFFDSPRLWVVRLTAHGTDPLAGLEEPKPTVLREWYIVANTWQSKAITVVLLERAPKR